MENWDDFETPFGVETTRINAPIRAVSIVSTCQICGKEFAYHHNKLICGECSSRLKAILYPKSANIDELI